ncbi:DUF6493 family protein [Streptomyces diastaticus]|uniref:DUF6493 family protein n=1 Tax=Streptomyces TaxID=1883 RepID=UPI001F5D1D37|nr:DUF6493 family protein [Streptomyces sp. BRB081]
MNSGHSNKDNPWLLALARLTAEGTLDRATVLEGCLGRLLRGGTAVEQRVFHRLLLDLGLSAEEHASRVADWRALAADALQPVAVHAQSVLAELALTGSLPTHDLADMTRAVLTRPEKNLVRAQLKLLDTVVTRDTATADALLPAASHALTHEDTEAQERALKLIERHGTHLTGAVSREEILTSAAPIAPGLRTRVAEALGTGAEEALHAAGEDTLPPVPSPVALASPPASVAETAEETGALLASHGILPVADFERTLDGLVRWAHEDRAALLEALKPVAATRYWSRTCRRPLPDDSVPSAFAPPMSASPRDSPSTWSSPASTSGSHRAPRRQCSTAGTRMPDASQTAPSGPASGRSPTGCSPIRSRSCCRHRAGTTGCWSPEN